MPALKAVLEEYLLAINQATQRVTRLEDLLAVQVPLWRMYPAVEALMCLRGFQLTAAAVLVAELGDVRRFQQLRRRCRQPRLTHRLTDRPRRRPRLHLPSRGRHPS